MDLLICGIKRTISGNYYYKKDTWKSASEVSSEVYKDNISGLIITQRRMRALWMCIVKFLMKSPLFVLHIS